ncbi:methyltransferase [Actinoplanes sp. SE50]|uniref:class I SAM-dependent methyltransferase n=1 Tax=unclassified Actinoplanes TaxID=2626549 RepID=UPI00023EBD6C|nr:MULTISPECIES: class I SAM-dependent methyltransferase [unclassified Actinoplanes]AEV85106.1 Ubiquinone/menaquinone biosynthesis methyltransferase ubiE [Actinoplanes sp. SE50/110]ATO83497.1 methyltransferase [Actinoplanes sp. SE50]SLM00904.1 methyltransferase [Actinoplanes sp. SE50/110]
MSYDDFAEAYASETEGSLENAYYARPAILDLAADVTGRRILDVGCGAGPLLEALRDRGADVTGIEPSAGMLHLARRRLGAGVALHRLGLGGDPLPFPDATFDDVVACLVLHYLEDWTGPLADLRRILKPGGRLIVAVNHPFLYKLIKPEGDYFAVEEWSDEFMFSGRTTVLTFWHRPLHAMFTAFLAAGFRVAVVSEPAPAPGAREAFPDLITSPSGRFMGFLFLVLDAA